MLWTVVLDKILESPLDCKEFQLVHPKGNQSWIFFGRTDAEAETPILWPPDAKNWLICKDLDAGNDWRREEKGTTEDEMVGWHHQLNGHDFDTPGFNDGQGSLVCCSPWGCIELDTIERLNWTESSWSQPSHSLPKQIQRDSRQSVLLLLQLRVLTKELFELLINLFFLNFTQLMIGKIKTYIFCPTSYFISYLRIASVADYQDSSIFVGQNTPALHFDFFSFVSKPCLLL